MKRYLLFAAALALSACGLTPPSDAGANPPPQTSTSPATTGPAALCDKTTIDEAAGIGATNTYTAASKLGASLARAGVIDRVAFKAADQRGYDAVQAVSAAYFACNSKTYAEAVVRAYAAAAAIVALAK